MVISLDIFFIFFGIALVQNVQRVPSKEKKRGVGKRTAFIAWDKV